MLQKLHRVSRMITTTYPPIPGESQTKKIALIPGHGMWPTVCESVVDVFSAINAPIEWKLFEQINPYDDSDIAAVLECRAGIKGMVFNPSNDKRQSPNIVFRKKLQVFADVIHAYNIEGLRSIHKNVNVVIIRENMEGEYSGLEHEVYPGVVESIKVTTAEASEKIANYAFEFAFMNNRKKVTAVHKANIMKMVDGEFLKAVRKAALNYPQIKYEEMIIDNASMQMVSNPWQFDVIVLPNLYGSIMANIASSLVGGPGIAPGVNIGKSFSLFEQGARHLGMDLKQGANPTATLLSSSLMLWHLGLPNFARRLQEAVYRAIKKGKNLTPDMGGSSGTREFTKEIIANLE